MTRVTRYQIVYLDTMLNHAWKTLVVFLVTLQK